MRPRGPEPVYEASPLHRSSLRRRSAANRSGRRHTWPTDPRRLRAAVLECYTSPLAQKASAAATRLARPLQIVFAWPIPHSLDGKADPIPILYVLHFTRKACPVIVEDFPQPHVSRT